MRCLILSQEFPPGPGGLGTHAFEVARNLTVRGWQVLVVTNQDHAPDDQISAFNRTQAFAITRIPRQGGPLRSFFDRWKAAREGIAGFRPRIMMATGDRANYIAANLARAFGIPWVAVEHGVVPRGFERRVKRWAYSQADALVCVSNYTWSQTARWGARPRRLEVIPNGADSVRFHRYSDDTRARAREELGLSGKRMLLTVGSVSVRKGQDTVIRALPAIASRIPDITYICAGINLVGEQFASLARNLGVGDRVRFVGPVSNEMVVDLMNSADVFVMTSRHTGDEFEGYGIAAVEAALCGVPSVVTADSGLAEAISEGETGFGIPQDDPESAASAILRLLMDSSLQSRMGDLAQARALADQTWEKRAARYDELFRNIVESRSGGRR